MLTHISSLQPYREGSDFLLNYTDAKIRSVIHVTRPCRNGYARFTLSTLTYSSRLRSRRALVMTETELKLMAAAANIGLSSKPKNG